MVTTTNASNSYGASATIPASVYDRIEKMMAPQKAGAVKLNTALGNDKTKLSALGQLNSALSGFQSVAKGLTDAGVPTVATPANAAVLKASGASAAAVGTYVVDVKQVAQGQVLTTAAQNATSTVIGGGEKTTITVDIGSTADGKFAPGEAKTKTITIDSGNNTLKGIAAAFQAAGINAQVVPSGAGFALALNGQPGEANSMRVSVSGDSALKSMLGYDPAGAKGMTETMAAQDALLTVDGKEIKSATNTIKDALPGVTLSLAAAGLTNVTVAQDPAQTAKNINALVSAYNTMNGQLQSLQAGALQGDVAAGQASRQLSQLMKTGGGASTKALSDAGITIDKDGNLQVDAKKLDSAIAADPAAVSKLFSNGGKGIADQMVTQIAGLTGSGGVIQRQATWLNKDIDVLNAKRDALSAALTKQANALLKLYTQPDWGVSPSGKPSLFDAQA